MATSTPKIGLIKPATNEYYNVETVQNANSNIIDTAFSNLDTSKLEKGGYTGTAQDLENDIGELNDVVKQLPDPRACLAFYADDNGRPRLWGDTELTGWKTANVNHYGESYIVTNPENTCNFISYKDSNGESKIYTGDSYMNSILYPNEVSPTVKITDYGDYIEMEQISEAITGFNFVRSALSFTGTFQLGIIGEKSEYVQAMQGGYPVSFTGYNFSSTDVDSDGCLGRCGINFKQGTPIGTKVKFRIQAIANVADVAPFIPIGSTFPGGAVSFNNTGGYNFDDYSYIIKNKENEGGDEDWFISNHTGAIYGVFFSSTENDYQIYSSSYKVGLKLYEGSVYRSDLLSITARRDLGRGLRHLSQFVAYKGSLTETELNTELGKDLYFDSIDLVTLIEKEENLRAVKTVTNLANTKEPKFTKNTGFNLKKSDSATSTSTTTLATSKAVSTAYDLANTKAPKSSPALTGTPTAPTPATSDNSAKIATTAFVKKGFTGSFSANGWRKTADGFIMQWGEVEYSTGGTKTITLPIAFPNAILNVQGSPLDVYDIREDGISITASKNGTSLTTILAMVDKGTGVDGIGCSWFAIGY